MPETTNNDAPGADRPTARAGQEGPSTTGGAAARPPGEMEAERQAREAVRSATTEGAAGGAERAAEQTSADGGSPTDTAP
jgi:hypothetical protein